MTDTVLDIDLESLVDMNIAPQCEHSDHKMFHPDAPAKYLIQSHYLCEHFTPKKFLMCEVFDRVKGALCHKCGARKYRDEAWTILEVL